MTDHSIRESLETVIRNQGIEVWGYCGAEIFSALIPQYEKRIQDGTACEFEIRLSHQDLVDPSRILGGAKGFLVVLIPHGPYIYDNKPQCGKMASGTAGTDYHLIMKDKLGSISEFLENEGIKNKIICDTSPLSDRAIAVRAGLGLIRRNNMLYHKRFGSYVHIGSILMDHTFASKNHSTINDPCGHCRRCVAACPGQAILGDGTINSNKCVSWLTQSKTLSDEQSVAIGEMVYGCDVCQRVCPANRVINNPAEDLLVPQEVALASLLAIGNRDFKKSFARTASGWRGKKVLQRNALAVLGNSGNPEAINVVQAYVNDQRPMIRDEALRSMKKLQGNNIGGL